MQYSPLLVGHICAGTVGLFSGAVAISLRKGSRWHGIVGTVFAVSMLFMAAGGAVLAVEKSQITNIVAGGMTCYLVATAWATGRRRDGETSPFDWLGLLLALSAATAMLTFGVQAALSPDGSKADVPAVAFFFLGSVVLLAAIGDARMIRRGGLFGRQRIVRHLWRMCFGWFIASGSIFLARPHLFPAIMRETNALLLLGVLPLLLMIFWLIRIHLKPRNLLAPA
jgi:hypothetical protein